MMVNLGCKPDIPEKKVPYIETVSIRLVEESQIPQSSQATVIALGNSLELDSKTLLLKTQYS